MSNNNNSSPDDLMPPPLGNRQGERCSIACIFSHVPIGTMHKCKECGKYLHGVCSALEDENDPSVGLGSNSICHDCFGVPTNVQNMISEGKILWDKLKAVEEWEARKNSPGGMEKGRKTELKKKAAKEMEVKGKPHTKVKGTSKVTEAKGKSLKWNAALIEIFVDAMVVEAQTSTAEGGFKSQSWNKLVLLVSKDGQAELEKQGLTGISKAQLQSKHSELKKKYSAFQKLVENSGFGWDEENQLPTADPSVWDKYLEKHPEAKEFRNKTLPHYQSLHEIFSGSVATGHYAFSSEENAFGIFACNDCSGSFSSATEEELQGIGSTAVEQQNNDAINVFKSPPLRPPSSLTVETSMNSNNTKNSRKRKASGGKNQFADDFLKHSTTFLEMMKEKVSTTNSFFAAMADSASNSVAVAQQSKREEAVDLFAAKYAANLDAMASLKVKQKLFNHDTAALFLKLTDEERFLFLDGLINGDE
jgi:hypothetical protein